MSYVWKFFTKEDLNTARCNEKGCIKRFKWDKGLFSMASHLKKVHNISDQNVTKHRHPQESSVVTSVQPAKRQKTLLEFSKKVTVGRLYLVCFIYVLSS